MEEKINSVTKYIDKLKSLFQHLKASDEIFSLWFRGEENNKWKTPLAPKAYRGFGGPLDGEEFTQHVYKQAETIEKNLKGTFSREAYPYLIAAGIERNPWNEYYLMQYYKLRTRLLDWTENALIALFFAVCEKQFQNEDGVVWILAPHRLNKFTINAICGKSASLNSKIVQLSVMTRQKRCSNSAVIYPNSLPSKP